MINKQKKPLVPPELVKKNAKPHQALLGEQAVNAMGRQKAIEAKTKKVIAAMYKMCLIVI